MGGYQCILCIGGYFTKYFVAVPLKNHTAPVVADAIVKEWVCKMGGCPVTIHSDRGPEFRGHIMKHMLEMLEIHQTFTTPYRPQSDGFVERFNRILREMLATATNDDPIKLGPSFAILPDGIQRHYTGIYWLYSKHALF